MFTRTALLQWLGEMGWDAREHDAQTLRCDRPTNHGAMSVFLRTHEHWFIATIVPFLSTRGENTFELSRWLLRQNRDMELTKFAYDEDGDVVITTELPTESLNFSEVKRALENLVRDAVSHRETLRQAANRSVAPERGRPT